MSHDRFGIVGKVIARTYQVESVVAEGGFGVVYLAYHKGFRAKVALKCLKIPDELTERQRTKFLEQFRSEAEVLFRLSGQIGNIVRPLHVDAFHLDDGRLVPFIALEWLDGRTLDAIIMRRAEKGRPPTQLGKLVRLLTPVAAALEQAHHLPGPNGTMSVVHRDMKPENLFVARMGDEDVAKILDFGISKVKSTAGQLAGRASRDSSTFVSFSPAYGAPEQWAPKSFGQTGRWTDVWGLAITVVEAIKGDLVVTGDHAAMMGTIIDPVRRPTPRNEGVEVSDAVEAVFEKAMAVDPCARYQSVGAFWNELTEALGIQHEVGKVTAKRQPQAAVSDDRSTNGFDSLLPPASISGALEAPVPRSPRGPVGSAVTTEAAPVRGPLGPRARGVMESSIDPSGPQKPQKAPAPRISLQPIRSLRPQQRSGAQAFRSRAPSHSPSGRSVLKALSPALSLVALSVAFTLLDRAVATAQGEPLIFGPIRASWIAAGCMVLALISGFSALKKVMHH